MTRFLLLFLVLACPPLLAQEAAQTAPVPPPASGPDVAGPEMPEPQDVPPLPDPTLAEVAGGTAADGAAQPIARPGGDLFRNLRREPDSFTLVNAKRGLSFHRPMYLLPVAYSPDPAEDNIEVQFQISLKQRLFNRDLFFGYTQRAFWQLYNGDASRPFRETNYNTELFYRYKPQWDQAPGLGFDLGLDHESNGKELPDSRSWNRVIGAIYHERAEQLWHLKLWYRIPENDDRAEDDPKRDDNPDIHRYYGYGELRYQHKLRGAASHQLALMVRGNPATGKGAGEISYSAPFSDYAFWNLYLWHGYGESLIDYDRTQTRVGVGFMLAR